VQPQNPPPYPQMLPPVRPPAAPQPQAEALTSEPPPPAAAAAPDPAPAVALEALNDLQTQLQTTQSSLASHHDKLSVLENVLQEHEAIKREVGILKGVVESLRAEGDSDGGGQGMEEDEEDHDPDADTRSINTIMPHPHELESVQEEDEDQLNQDAAASLLSSSFPSSSELDKVEEELELEENDEDRRRRRDELGRPRTPEPSSLVLDFRRSPTRSKMAHSHSSLSRLSPTSPSALDELTQRLGALSMQLESALELSSTLQVQQVAAQGTIKALEEKVERLEGLARNAPPTTTMATPAQEPTPSSSLPLPPAPPADPPAAAEQERESLTQLLASFQKSVDGQWSSVRLEWKEERERLNRAREEFEAKMKVLESGIEDVRSFRALNKASSVAVACNGDIKGGGGGLVTPPSPRSLSGDSSNSSRRRKRGGAAGRKVSLGGSSASSCSPSRRGRGGRGRSTSPATSATLASSEEYMDEMGDLTGGAKGVKGTAASVVTKAGFEEDAASCAPCASPERHHKLDLFPITPESSVRLGTCDSGDGGSARDSLASDAAEGVVGVGLGKREFTDVVRLFFFFAFFLIS
jgi:hypothetical protein